MAQWPDDSMTQSPCHFERFIHAVHRRWVVLRALERCGACAVVGCVIAAGMAGAGMWIGRDVLGVSAMLIAGGAVAGLAWGAARRPTLHMAAAEADRQLDLNDLLATAL